MKLFIFTIICAFALFVLCQVAIYFLGLVDGLLLMACLLVGYWISKTE